MTLDLLGENLSEVVVDLSKKEILMVVVDPLVVAMEGEDL
jgi:hypothetical protein